MDEDERLFVADTSNDRVMCFSPGLPPAVVCSGTKGYPSSVEVGASAVYVCDTLNHRVLRYPWPATDGAATVVAGGHGEGAALNQLYTHSV